MKWHKSESDYKGKEIRTEGEGPGSKGTPTLPLKPMSKTMGTLSGNQKQVILNGIRLWVDDKGVILRGPDPLIGLDFDKLRNVPWMIVWDSVQSAARAMNVHNNKNLSPADREAIKLAENKKVKLTKSLEDFNTSRYNKLAPGTVAR